MKVTYLVFSNDNFDRTLRIASREEWSQIMKANREVSRDKKRYFIESMIEEGDERDLMYIETEKEAYDKWHSENQKYYRNKKAALRCSQFAWLSMDTCLEENESKSIVDCMSDGNDWESRVLDKVYVDEIRQRLKKWNDWALPMFEYLLEFYRCNGGDMEHPSRYICRTQNIKARTYRARKQRLEEYIRTEFKLC